MRKKLFTGSVLAEIPQWIRDEGLGPAEIAENIGCTIGTLRVRCSHYGISLRKPLRSRRPRHSGSKARPLWRTAHAMRASLLASAIASRTIHMGQTRTFQPRWRMSAIPPIAEVTGALSPCPHRAFDVLRRDQADGVAQLSQAAADMVRTGAGLHSDQAARNIC
jgi:hypothetical protein